MKNFRILPVLIFVVALAFSLRLVEVASGISDLPGAAYAKGKTAPDSAPKSQEVAGDSAAQAGHEEGKEDAGVEGTDAGGEDGEQPEHDWKDASDTDMEFSDVKMEMFDDLSARRKELELRESNLITREALMKAAEQELDRKYQELSQLRQELEKLLGQQSEEEEKRIGSLVKIYEGMKPKDAARIFDTLDLDILVSVMSRMSERKLSPVLASMNPERARTITIMLAEQKTLPALPGNH